MEPWLLEFWWAAPAAAGAAGAGFWALWRRGADRRLGYDAARAKLRAGIAEAATKQHVVRVARAELARVAAERTASRATVADVAHARRQLQAAQRDAKAAAAAVRALRARVATARAEIPSRSEPAPLERLRTAHDTVLVRWMDYETDPAKQIAYPTMSDGKTPSTAAFLAALERAQHLRPASDQVTLAEYSAYEDAVAALERAFADAERAAHEAAGERQAPPQGWQDAAQQVIILSAEALDRAAKAAASALAAWRARGRTDGTDDRR